MRKRGCAVLTASAGLGRVRAGARRFVGGTGASRPSSAAPKVCVERALSRADLPQLGKASREAFSSRSLLPLAAAGRSSVPVGQDGPSARVCGTSALHVPLPLLQMRLRQKEALLKPGG